MCFSHWCCTRLRDFLVSHPTLYNVNVFASFSLELSSISIVKIVMFLFLLTFRTITFAMAPATTTQFPAAASAKAETFTCATRAINVTDIGIIATTLNSVTTDLTKEPLAAPETWSSTWSLYSCWPSSAPWSWSFWCWGSKAAAWWPPAWQTMTTISWSSPPQLRPIH